MAKSVTPQRGRALAQARVADAWKSFYATPEGRAAIAELMIWCNVYQECTETDMVEIMRQQGEKNVAVRIIKMIGLTPAEAPVDAWEDEDILHRITGGQ